MSDPLAYPVPVSQQPTTEPPARPPRPVTVTVAFFLQLAIVGVLLLVLAAIVAVAIHYNAAIDRVAARTGADPAEVAAERGGSITAAVVSGTVCLLLAAWLAACAVPLRRGSNVARILVFVVSGLQLLACLGPCGGFAFAPLAFLTEPVPPEVAEDPEYGVSPFLDQLTAETDSAIGIFFAIASLAVLVVFVLTVAMVVLLIVPTSNRFFLPRPALPPFWPYPVYVGYPGPAHGVPGYGPSGYGPPGYAAPGYGVPAYGHPSYGPPGYGFPPVGYPWPPGYWPAPPVPWGPSAGQWGPDPAAQPAPDTNQDPPPESSPADPSATSADPSPSASDQGT